MVYILSGSCCAMYRSLQVFLKAKTVHENSNCAIPCKLALVRLLSARVLACSTAAQLQPVSANLLQQKSSNRWVECRKTVPCFSVGDPEIMKL